MLRDSYLNGGEHERVLLFGMIWIKVIDGALAHEDSWGVQLGDESVVETPVELVITHGIGK